MWMLFWFGLAVLLFIIELSTVELVVIWFAIAALISGIIASIFTSLNIVWQAAIFVAIATALFFATRPFVKRFMAKKKGQETNLELIIGNIARVTERIENNRVTGLVKINGLTWTARSKDGEVIEVDELVIVKEIQGNKLIVEKQNS